MSSPSSHAIASSSSTSSVAHKKQKVAENSEDPLIITVCVDVFKKNKEIRDAKNAHRNNIKETNLFLDSKLLAFQRIGKQPHKRFVVGFFKEGTFIPLIHILKRYMFETDDRKKAYRETRKIIKKIETSYLKPNEKRRAGCITRHYGTWIRSSLHPFTISYTTTTAERECNFLENRTLPLQFLLNKIAGEALEQYHSDIARRYTDLVLPSNCASKQRYWQVMHLNLKRRNARGEPEEQDVQGGKHSGTAEPGDLIFFNAFHLDHLNLPLKNDASGKIADRNSIVLYTDNNLFPTRE
ncbi:10630_t:CDS:2 [Ambispora leptoticha]|uniref:10630_t:CDS:1 n=1 Tax=Ambispora leptoticha TaxID=144679 RepID=A0A9N8YVT0_9GLOM|nr:10630_t:CDS:2 [Ambispora leptoticha]